MAATLPRGVFPGPAPSGNVGADHKDGLATSHPATDAEEKAQTSEILSEWPTMRDLVSLAKAVPLIAGISRWRLEEYFVRLHHSGTAHGPAWLDAARFAG